MRTVLFVAAAVALFLARPAYAACTDLDGDGHYPEQGCGGSVDCNDADPSMWPGAVELCDGYDNDCDGFLDNAISCQGACVSPEISIAAPSFGLAADNDEVFPRIVWAEDRYAVVSPDEVYGLEFQIVGLQGELIVPTRFLGPGAPPTLAWTGEHFGVAYWDTLLRLDISGNVVGTPTSLPWPLFTPQVVWNGAEYQVIGAGCGGLCYARIRADGNVLSTSAVFSSSGWVGHPSVTTNPSGLAIVWISPAGLLFGRLDRTGNQLAPATLVAVGSDCSLERPALAWNGSQYGVVWERHCIGGADDVFFRALAHDGSPLAEEVLVVRGQTPRLVWTGVEYGLVWGLWGDDGSPSSYFCRLSENGVCHDILAIGDGLVPDLAWNGVDYRASYLDYDPFEYRTRGIGCNCANGCDADIDGDGVANGTDLCAATPSGSTVLPDNGCSIAQLIPCSGPRNTNQPWKSHGQYTSSFARAAGQFLGMGLITEADRDALVAAAAASECGSR